MSQVKFKIGFTIGAEALFGLIARIGLPIEDLSVEEFVEKPKAERAIAHKPKPQTNKRASPGPNLTKGINGILITALADGPQRAVEMQPKVVAAGFSANSVNSRLEELSKYGVVVRDGKGAWKRADAT